MATKKIQHFFSHSVKATFIALTVTICGMLHSATAANPGNPVAPVKISATIDTTTITMGERTTLHVELLKNGHIGTVIAPVQMPQSQEGTASIGKIEVRQIDVDSTDLGNNRIQVKYDILLQPFDPDEYILPAFKYAIDTDTFTSNVVALKVLEPEIPQEMRDSLVINPLRPPMTIKAEWYDWVPNWITEYWFIWLPILLLLIGAIFLRRLYKKNGGSFLSPKRKTPPYELAVQRLENLKKKRLHEQGHYKAYYTELTDILRQYLGGRFKIYALEMTSTQILAALEENPETAPFAEQLRPMFKIADYVKFAKQDSTTDENIRSFNAVNKFVNETRPAESETSEKSKKKK